MPENMHLPVIVTFSLLTFFVLGGNAAQAAVITNLSDTPQTFEIKTSEGFTPVTILAGRTWRVPGKADIRRGDRVVHMEEDQEYAIWQNGDFGPQRRMKQATGAIE